MDSQLFEIPHPIGNRRGTIGTETLETPRTPPNSLYGEFRVGTPYEEQRFDPIRRDITAPGIIHNVSVSDPFRSPIVESDSDSDDERDEGDSMFGESLQDALAAIEFVTNGQNDDDDISDSDSEPESSSIVEPASSPTIYSSTPPTSSNHSLQVLVESDPGDDADDDISTEYSELTGFKREGKSKEENLVDITVMDHGTHTVTRTLIRPLKTRKRNALGFFTSLVSPEPVRTTLSRPRPVKSYLNLKLMGSSNGPSGELVCRPTSPVFSFLTNHAANTLALGGLTRPSTPTTTNTTTITTTTPESQRIFPFLLNNPLFEEDIDTREEQWTKEKSGTGAIEISVEVEVKVTIEETSSDESDENLSLGFRGVQGVRGVVRELGLGLYAPEREYPRGLLGPRDQPRRRVFSPPPMRRS